MMALTKEDLQAIVLLLDDGLSPITKETLLLQSDNTALLLKLSNQQAGEISGIKSRVEALEMKLA